MKLDGRNVCSLHMAPTCSLKTSTKLLVMQCDAFSVSWMPVFFIHSPHIVATSNFVKSGYVLWLQLLYWGHCSFFCARCTDGLGLLRWTLTTLSSMQKLAGLERITLHAFKDKFKIRNYARIGEMVAKDSGKQANDTPKHLWNGHVLLGFCACHSPNALPLEKVVDFASLQGIYYEKCSRSLSCIVLARGDII